MTAVAIMLQGTGSDVGKSLLVAGLCRIARRRGIAVAPFKPQNMSNNAAACAGGGEIGRAQALQARAAGLAPHTDMNPVLLKPESDRRAQVVLNGRVLRRDEAAAYIGSRGSLLPDVVAAFDRLCARHELVIVEGAGSPAEVNLRRGDIANMGFAEAVGIPVVLVGDIDRGGVIAAIAGTRHVLSPADAGHIRGFIINRFRGDIALFDDGVRFIEDHCAWPCLGVVPWLDCAARLPAEDAVMLERMRPAASKLLIAVPMVSRISNFDDFDPLRAEPAVDLRFIPPGTAIPRAANAILLPGTKSTRADLAMLRREGWDHDIHAAFRTGAHIVGICGGFQILGRRIDDSEGHDGTAGTAEGLRLFDMVTTMSRDKLVNPVTGRTLAGDVPISGYEIHSGRSSGPALADPLLRLDDGRTDGAIAAGGRLIGSYVHGLFANDEFRRRWLESIASGSAARIDYEAGVDQALDALADGLEAALDVDALFALATRPR